MSSRQQPDERRTRLPILDDGDDDPLTSAVNLVDVFFVAMVILMAAIVNDPSHASADETVTIIKNAGEPTMEIIVKNGSSTERFEASGASSRGNGTKAGVAYRMNDGTMVYVPQPDESANR